MTRIINVLAVVSVVLFALYTAFWCWGLSSIHRDLSQLWANAPQQQLILSNPPPRITGYPGQYQITWSGLIQSLDGNMTIPDLHISFLPLPRTIMTIDMPNGFQFASKEIDLPPEMPALLFKKFYAAFEVPTHLPQEWTKGEVQKLVAAKVVYRLTDLHGIGPILPDFVPEWRGAGEMDFDENLQPRGILNIEFQQPEKIRDILATVIRSPLGKSFAIGAINSMMKTDADGHTTLPIAFKLQNGKIYAGPLQVGYVGTTYWPIDNPPAPDQ